MASKTRLAAFTHSCRALGIRVEHSRSRCGEPDWGEPPRERRTKQAKTGSHLDQVAALAPSSRDARTVCVWAANGCTCACACRAATSDAATTHRTRHLTAHFNADQHPIIQSHEPGEDWWYCYLDDLAFLVDAAPAFVHP
jgi:hypothetical protein